jgi:hypothetical protein
MPVVNVHTYAAPSPVPSASAYFLTLNTFDGGNVTFNIELDPALVTTAGTYAVIRSIAPMTNLATPPAVAGFSPQSSSLQVTAVTRGNATFDAVVYDCILVTVGPRSPYPLPPDLQDYFFLVDAFNAGGTTIPLTLNPDLFPTAGKYAVICSRTTISNLSSPLMNVTFNPPTTKTVTYVGRETLMIAGFSCDCIVIVVAG